MRQCGTMAIWAGAVKAHRANAAFRHRPIYHLHITVQAGRKGRRPQEGAGGMEAGRCHAELAASVGVEEEVGPGRMWAPAALRLRLDLEVSQHAACCDLQLAHRPRDRHRLQDVEAGGLIGENGLPLGRCCPRCEVQVPEQRPTALEGLDEGRLVPRPGQRQADLQLMAGALREQHLLGEVQRAGHAVDAQRLVKGLLDAQVSADAGNVAVYPLEEVKVHRRRQHTHGALRL
mmetsp:Transcript_15382/g.44187  ORF Transcript_15382/g.44187 Transcript_15382/m.44187 type:complete len:232 (+) Transcript_15382:207-902(+)